MSKPTFRLLDIICINEKYVCACVCVCVGGDYYWLCGWSGFFKMLNLLFL